ncbi:MAG: N-acetylmuramoyl-L-alanine amidase [Anaerolineae bacterium]|nr:N-acetylmuramoyl-L-alanine amidase [Anaerolineae bacterium]
MPDDHRPDDDAEFKAWARKSEDEPPDIPASVTFMEMMRQAAARASGAARAEPREEAAPAKVTDEPPPKPRRTTPPPPVRRVRRRQRRARAAVSMIGGLLRTFIIVIVAAGLMATIFTWWTPTEFISDRARQGLSIVMETQAATVVPTTLPTPNWARRIGIVSGHRGNDSGAVCDDGLTEASINLSVAELVVRDLRGLGYTVDLLDEFDPRLNDFQASALVSIHSNTCRDFGEPVSGFLVAASAGRITSRTQDDELVNCIAQHYATTTRLARRMETTIDMTDYHTFREINVRTPAAIIEIGFMLADRDLLTQHPDMVARGITDGVLCYLEPGQ